MKPNKMLRVVHISGIFWFFFCSGYLLVLALQQAGLSWSAIFTLSGHWMVIMAFLALVYLYAFFKNADKNIEIEHPLTSSIYYLWLYTSTPFVGGIAGVAGCVGLFDGIGQVAGTGALATLLATIVFWIVIDPFIVILEPIVIPTSRKAKSARLARHRQLKRQQEQQRRSLLDKALAAEAENRQTWHRLLANHARNLADILADSGLEPEFKRYKTAEFGLLAWQIGGLACMKELRSMVQQVAGECGIDRFSSDIDYVPFWWDGIGNWRMPDIGTLRTA